jgi:hypothetical protein
MLAKIMEQQFHAQIQGYQAAYPAPGSRSSRSTARRSGGWPPIAARTPCT